MVKRIINKIDKALNSTKKEKKPKGKLKQRIKVIEIYLEEYDKGFVIKAVPYYGDHDYIRSILKDTIKIFKDD